MEQMQITQLTASLRVGIMRSVVLATKQAQKGGHVVISVSIATRDINI